MSPRSALLFPDEAEVERDQEESEMRDRAQAVDLGRYHEIRAEDRDRRVDEVEVKQDPRIHEERAGQKLADLYPIDPHVR